MARKPEQPRIDFEKMIGFGENPKGFTAQTPNGTAHWKGTGWNRPWGDDYTQLEVTPSAVWREGRNNRTGE